MNARKTITKIRAGGYSLSELRDLSADSRGTVAKAAKSALRALSDEATATAKKEKAEADAAEADAKEATAKAKKEKAEAKAAEAVAEELGSVAAAVEEEPFLVEGLGAIILPRQVVWDQQDPGEALASALEELGVRSLRCDSTEPYASALQTMGDRLLWEAPPGTWVLVLHENMELDGLNLRFLLDDMEEEPALLVLRGRHTDGSRFGMDWWSGGPHRQLDYAEKDGDAYAFTAGFACPVSNLSDAVRGLNPQERSSWDYSMPLSRQLRKTLPVKLSRASYTLL